MNILRPSKLLRGDTIGIVAPSLPLVDPVRPAYNAGRQMLLDMGFQLKEGATVGLQRWWSAGTPRDQATDINRMFADPEVRAIIAVMGGFSAMSVVDHLDYDLVRRHPKPFLGISDITQYQWAMFTKCGLVGFHFGGVIDGFGGGLSELARADYAYLAGMYSQALTSTAPLGLVAPLSEWQCWRRGRAQGYLLGGSLKRFVALAGTQYFPPLDAFDGAILFWEEIGETLYDISLNLYKLKLLGIFERIVGMVVGKLTWVNQYFDWIEHPSNREAVLDVVREYDFPILADVDFGHNIAALPMLLGVQAHIDADARTLSFTEAAVQ